MGDREGWAGAPDHPGLLPGLLHPGLGPGRRSARDWLSDGAGVVVALGLAAVVLVLRMDAGPGFPGQWWDLAVGAVSCVLLWWRRRRPVGVAVTLVVLSVVFPAAAGASLIGLFTVAVHRPTRATAGVTVLAVVSAFPQYLLLFDRSDLAAGGAGLYWAAVGVSGLLCVLAAVWGGAVRARRQLVASLAERTRRVEAEQQLRVERAQRLERERIAREMHDVLGHRLSLLSMHAGVLEFRPDAPAKVIAETAAVIRASAQRSLGDLRETLTVLRATDQDGPLRPQPSVDRLEQLLDETRETGTAVEFVDERGAGQVPDGLGRTVYRIVQEGLTNARRHARGQPVHVVLGGSPGQELIVEMRNPLDAGAPAEVPGLGLVGLGERVSLSGGRLEHGRTPSGEFRMRASLPWMP